MFAPALLCLLAVGPHQDDGSGDAADPPLVASFLYAGDLGGAEEALTARLAEQPGDADARFSLAAVTFLRGIERLAQFLHATGPSERSVGLIPFARLPVPPNPDPRPVTYEEWREARVDLLAAFADADAVLAKVDGPVDVRLDLARIRLDLDGDGTATEAESVGGLFLAARRGSVGRRTNRDAPATELLTHFDRADAEWIRGYCDLLSAILETMLAHDAENWWNHCAHLLFARPEGVPAYLTTDVGQGFGMARISDFIAAVHHVNFPVRDAGRMRNARRHLLGMIEHSRAMWDLIEAEADTESPEWIPGPEQRSVTGLTMSRERIDGWMAFLDEAEALLNGEALAPFWRPYPDGEVRGVNIRRVFEEPRRFDLVEWVQGPGAEPYVEIGPVTEPEQWARFQRLFNGNFAGFALWIN